MKGTRVGGPGHGRHGRADLGEPSFGPARTTVPTVPGTAAVCSRALTRVALPLAVCALWAPTLRAPFTYDDKIEVVGNRTIRLLDDVGAIASYNTSRPLLIATYALNWWLGGLDPVGYHVVSIAIHALNAALVQRLFGRFVAPGVALLAAALWALHPMCTESVTYVTGRSDALCATGWLVALTAWIDHLRGTPASGRISTRAVAMLGLAGALLTKEVAIGLPFAMLGAEVFLVRGGRLREVAWRPYGALAAIGLGAVALRLAMYGWPRPEVPRDALTQLLTQAEVWVRYAQLWIVPIGQSILHDVPASASGWGAAALGGWLAALALAMRAGGVPAFAAVLWATCLVPSSLPPLRETMAEHRALIAGLAPALLVASAVGRARPAWILVLPLAGATLLRHRVWSSEETLWEEAARRNPQSARAQYGWGDALRLDHRWAEAEAAYRAALALDPDSTDARINLGITRAEQGDRDGARDLWLEVLRKEPRNCAAHNDLAGLDRREGNVAAAIRGYASTLAWCPRDPLANLNLANLYRDLGDTEKARWHYHAYLDVAPEGLAAETAREELAKLGG